VKFAWNISNPKKKQKQVSIHISCAAVGFRNEIGFGKIKENFNAPESKVLSSIYLPKEGLKLNYSREILQINNMAGWALRMVLSKLLHS
jgi:hypothetical protein